MKTRSYTPLLLAALLGTAAATVRAQAPEIDRRWIGYLGCWQEVGSASHVVCIVPADSVAVELLGIANGTVATRERIDAAGVRRESVHGTCTAWRSAAWSARGARVYLESGDDCPRSWRGGGVIAMTGDGEWLYIQSMTVSGQTGVQVQRYRELESDVTLPDEVSQAPRFDVTTTAQLRAIATAPLAIADVVDASRHLDSAVLEAWLAESGQPFRVDAKALVTLANARVPSRVIDLMVALSYPLVFAINPQTRQPERLAPPPGEYGVGDAGATTYDMPSGARCAGTGSFYSQDLYDCYSAYGYPYGYGYGWYAGGTPVTVVYLGSGRSHSHGRVVNGQGYQAGADDAAPAAIPRLDPSWSGSGGSASSGSSGSTSTSSSSSSSGSSGRTAHHRP